nr:hypothetical protein GCM10025732_20250 [Glycomyces mayteni]
MRQARDEARAEQESEVGGERGRDVRARERQHQADEQRLAGDAGGGDGEQGRAEDDADRVGGDGEAGLGEETPWEAATWGRMPMIANSAVPMPNAPMDMAKRGMRMVCSSGGMRRRVRTLRLSPAASLPNRSLS